MFLTTSFSEVQDLNSVVMMSVSQAQETRDTRDLQRKTIWKRTLSMLDCSLKCFMHGIKLTKYYPPHGKVYSVIYTLQAYLH